MNYWRAEHQATEWNTSRHPILMWDHKVLTPIICHSTAAYDVGIWCTSKTLVLLVILAGLTCDIMCVIYGWLSPVNTLYLCWYLCQLSLSSERTYTDCGISTSCCVTPFDQHFSMLNHHSHKIAEHIFVWWKIFLVIIWVRHDDFEIVITYSQLVYDVGLLLK